MTDTPNSGDRVHEIHETIIWPMIKQHRFDELQEAIVDLLKDETDGELRSCLMSELAMDLQVAGAELDSLRWVIRVLTEFDDDPYSWWGLAHWHRFSRLPERSEDQRRRKALQHYKTTIELNPDYAIAHMLAQNGNFLLGSDAGHIDHHAAEPGFDPPQWQNQSQSSSEPLYSTTVQLSAEGFDNAALRTAPSTK